MKTICKMLGGSRAYGLETPASDYDEGYVFMHTDSRYIIGLDRFEHIDNRANSEDSFGFELRHFLNLFNLKEYNEKLAQGLLEIKLYPENITKREIEILIDGSEEKLKKDFDNRKFDYKFNENIANDICKELYLKVLNEPAHKN